MSLRLWWALLWIDANMEHTSLQTSNLHLSIHPPCSSSPPPTPPPCLLFIFVHLHPPRRQTAPLRRPAADHARLSVLQMFTMFTQMLWRGHSMIKSQEVVVEFWPSTVLPHKMKWLSLRARKMSYSIPPIDITDCTKAEGGGKGGVFHPLCWIMRSHSIMCPSTAELCLWKWKLTRSLKQGDLPTWMSRGCRNLFLCCPKQKNLDEAGGGSTEKKPSRIERWLA